MYSLTALIDGSGFVKIPAGEFMVGSGDATTNKDPIHRVRISQSFEMGKVEVTQAQWDTVMRDPHAKPDSKAVATDANPSHFIRTIRARGKRFVASCAAVPTETECTGYRASVSAANGGRLGVRGPRRQDGVTFDESRCECLV